MQGWAALPKGARLPRGKGNPGAHVIQTSTLRKELMQDREQSTQETALWGCGSGSGQGDRKHAGQCVVAPPAKVTALQVFVGGCVLELPPFQSWEVSLRGLEKPQVSPTEHARQPGRAQSREGALLRAPLTSQAMLGTGWP